MASVQGQCPWCPPPPPCLHPRLMQGTQAEPALCPQVSECGWAARRAPSLRSLYSVCRNMHSWLRQDHKNVCVVHCVVSVRLPHPCPSFTVVVGYLRRKCKPGEITHALGELTIC